MSFRNWSLSLLVGAVLAIVGCSNPPAPPPVPQQLLTQVKEYFASNPADVPTGWSRGILIISRQVDFECLAGICHTWEGAVVKDNGSVTGLASTQGKSEIYSSMSVGDDITWTGTPDYKSDVRVLKQQAVTINLTQPPPTS